MSKRRKKDSKTLFLSLNPKAKILKLNWQQNSKYRTLITIKTIAWKLLEKKVD